MGSSPSIACIGIIGKHVCTRSYWHCLWPTVSSQSQDNPLHISIFPPHQHANLELSFMLNSSLDLIDAQRRRTAVEQDLGLLHAYDERYATYGWLLNTGTKLLIIVDVGDRPFAETKGLQPLVGLHESDLKSVCCGWVGDGWMVDSCVADGMTANRRFRRCRRRM